MDHYDAVAYANARTITNYKIFRSFEESDIFLRDLMIDEFVEFLANDNFPYFERAMFLHNFLLNPCKADTIDYLFQKLRDAEIEEDFSRVTLQWKYNNTTYIFDKLNSLDSEGLVLTKEQNNRYRERLKEVNSRSNAQKNLTLNPPTIIAMIEPIIAEVEESDDEDE